jgi:hypothetical protein
VTICGTRYGGPPQADLWIPHRLTSRSSIPTPPARSQACRQWPPASMPARPHRKVTRAGQHEQRWQSIILFLPNTTPSALQENTKPALSQTKRWQFAIRSPPSAAPWAFVFALPRALGRLDDVQQATRSRTFGHARSGSRWTPRDLIWYAMGQIRFCGGPGCSSLGGCTTYQTLPVPRHGSTPP